MKSGTHPEAKVSNPELGTTKRACAIGCLLIAFTALLILFCVRCVQNSSVASSGSIEFLHDKSAVVVDLGCDNCDSGVRVYDDVITIRCLAHFAGVREDGWLGTSICQAGDYDLDGESDFVVVASNFMAAHPMGAILRAQRMPGPQVTVVGSRQVAPVAAVDLRFTPSRSAVSVVSLDGDAPTADDDWAMLVDDLSWSAVVADRFARSTALLYEGGSSTARWRVEGPGLLSAARADDVDGDGVLDVLIGFTTQRAPPELRLLSGSTGECFATARLGGSSSRLVLARIGDLDGDGLSEFAVGGFAERPGQGVAVHFVCGRSLELRRTIWDDDGFGRSIVAIKSSDDSRVSVLVAKPYASQESGGTGEILEVDTERDGSLRTFSGAIGQSVAYGRSLTNLGNLDGRAGEEVAIGAMGVRGSIEEGILVVMGSGGLLFEVQGMHIARCHSGDPSRVRVAVGSPNNQRTQEARGRICILEIIRR